MTDRTARVLLVSALAWGVLMFGAVYPWAYWPLMAMTALIGVLALVRSGEGRAPSRILMSTLVIVALAIGVQLVPLPASVVNRISPETLGLVQKLDVRYAVHPHSPHSLSIDARATGAGILICLALLLYFAGATKLFSRGAARTVATSIAGLGLVVSLVGIIQKPLYTGKIYGLWPPVAQNAEPFGPFVNKNHFAGWMLMALPLTLGLIGAGISEGMRGVRPRWHDRLLWFGSAKASQLVLLAIAAAIMSLALVLTMSRAGMAALALALLVSGAAVVVGGKARARQSVALGGLLLLAIGVVWWVGADTIASRFSETTWTNLNDRRGFWSDTWRVIQAFPLTGTGFNTYDTAMLFYQRHLLEFRVTQAHNDYLQLLAEGGALLAIPCVIAAFVFAYDAAARLREAERDTTSWWLRVGAITGLLAIALQETFDFSLQMPGNAVMCVTLCAIAVHRAPASRRHRERDAR